MISIAIMAVEERRQHVEKITGLLDVPIEVVWDTDRKGPWWCWREAWLRRNPEATHHVVLQDDILPCADLCATLEAIVESRPNDVISGFLPRKSVEKAHESNLHWVLCRRFLWGQCLMMPRTLGDEAIRWIDANEGSALAEKDNWSHHDDVRLASFFRGHKLGVYVTVPNIVEHVGDELGSVLNHHGPAHRRRARVWVGSMGYGAKINWNDLRYVRE